MKIDEILPLVQNPSRYLGNEINRIKKDMTKIKLKIALAFPDLYEIGTSHFGISILYHILNNQEFVAAERVFAPFEDMETKLRENQIPLSSLESAIPLNQFDIIGFSLLYELNYTNVLNMLDLARIPLLSKNRDKSFPLIIAGGPCTCNPEPVADFFDAMVIGDGEQVFLDMADVWIKLGKNFKKEELLFEWAKIKGVYIPSFFKVKYNNHGLQQTTSLKKDYSLVKRAIICGFDSVSFPDKPVIPYGKPIHDRLRIEIARGCSRGCRFCQAGMIYRPVRERSPEDILSKTKTALKNTGYEDISLLSLSTGDYNSIGWLTEQLMGRCEKEKIAVSLPSLRAGTLTPKLMQQIKKVRKTGFTIAPEAGTQRLRNVINKNINQDEIFETVRNAFDLGWKVIKLYFMIGLPTETSEDLEGILNLIKELKKIKSSGRMKGQINVSITTFIPKAHTPFQWEPQLTLNKSSWIIEYLKGNLKRPGIRFKWQNPKTSLLEGVFARGDRKLSRVLIKAFEKGCKFDGWSDKFKFNLWEEAFAETGIDISFYTSRQRDPDEPLPWDHIDSQINKEFLKKELEKAKEGALTFDCRNGECNLCGVCDFKSIQPVVFENPERNALNAVNQRTVKEINYHKIVISYSKKGKARFFSHLELINIIIRATRRANIPIKFSQGFHPLPKISFKDPLPIGVESEKEEFYLIIPTYFNIENMVKNLNHELPPGIRILDSKILKPALKKQNTQINTYQVIINDGFFSKKGLISFNNSPQYLYTTRTKKGREKEIDLKEAIIDMSLIKKNCLQIKIKDLPGKKIRPFLIITHIFNLTETQAKQAKILKTAI